MKFEIRSTKSETNTDFKFECSKQKRFEFRYLNFEFVSSFDIRISDLSEPEGSARVAKMLRR